MELGKVMNRGSEKEYSFLEGTKGWYGNVLKCDSPVNISVQELAGKNHRIVWHHFPCRVKLIKEYSGPSCQEWYRDNTENL